MKKMKSFNLMLAAILLVPVIFFISCDEESLKGSDPDINMEQRGGGAPATDCILTDALETVTDQETDNLLFMREEEKLARDMYLSLYELYGADIFTRIAQSEQNHMNRILCLLDFYGIPDPASENIGEFKNQALQTLFNELLEKGSESFGMALIVGATIEDVDILDLEESMGNTENPAITRIYLNLQCGSASHLRAFASNLESLGESYVPQYISQEDFELILSGDFGDCDLRGQGSKGGSGNGNKGNGNKGKGDDSCDGSGNNGGNNGGNKGGNGDGTGTGGNGNGDGDGICNIP